MARIPESELARLKRDIPLVELVQAGGIELKRQGKDFAGLCPFHDDKGPSLIVSPQKNIFHCFGCGACGTVIDWKMKLENLSFRQAVESLQQASSPLVAQTPETKTPATSGPIVRTSEQQAILDRTADYYHRVLKDSPRALNYLKTRGLAHPELIDTFKLGYANHTLTNKVPNRDSKAGREQ